MAKADGSELIHLSRSSLILSLDKPMDLKQGDKESILKPFPLVTAKPKQERKQTTTSAPAFNSMSYINDYSCYLVAEYQYDNLTMNVGAQVTGTATESE